MEREGRPGGKFTAENNVANLAEERFQSLFKGKGLFEPHTPPGEDFTLYPILRLSELELGFKRKILDATEVYEKPPADKAQVERWEAMQESIQKIEMAYEIVAYPRLRSTRYGSGFRATAHDALEHPGDNMRDTPYKPINEFPRRVPFELNEEERKVLGKITRARGLPFDPEKRVYRYTEILSIPAQDPWDEATYSRNRKIIERNSIRRGLHIVPKEGTAETGPQGSEPPKPKPEK